MPIVRGGAMSQQAMQRGPAMLVTHGCALDKRTRAGVSNCEYFSFVPLQSFDKLLTESADKGRELQRKSELGEVAPYSALFLGDIPDLGASYVPLNQPFTLPSTLFQPEVAQYSAEETGVEGGDLRLSIGFNDTRIASVNQSTLEMFHQKWLAYWTGKTATVQP